MSGLFSGLNSSLDALRAFDTALQVSQNNVSNSSTPGYARQVATLESLPFDLAAGSGGGVQSGPTQSTQNEYADQAVRTQYSLQGNYSAQSNALASIQSLFDVTGQTGVIGALNGLFQSLSAWSATPNSVPAQQAVLASAQTVAQNFQSTAHSLSGTANSLNQEIKSTVQQINSIAANIRNDNAQIQQNHASDPGLDANLHASLESLSQLTDITVQFASDGTATVLLGGGQSPLVIGNQQNSLQTGFANSDAQILDSNGQDITGQISQGSLGGLLNVRNTILTSMQGDSTQQGSLNQLAQQVADRVNQILTSPTTPGGQPGTPLFAYNPAAPAGVAESLSVDPGASTSNLAPSDPGPPPVSNGAALTLSNLGNSTDPASQIGGQSILQYLTSIATQVGQQASDSQDGQTLHTSLLSQAQSVQTQISGVSLNAEAVQVLELQKSYSAVSKMVSVIDTLTTDLINMIK